MIACIVTAAYGMRMPTPKAPSPRASVQNRRKVTKNLWISVAKIRDFFISYSARDFDRKCNGRSSRFVVDAGLLIGEWVFLIGDCAAPSCALKYAFEDMAYVRVGEDTFFAAVVGYDKFTVF